MQATHDESLVKPQVLIPAASGVKVSGDLVYTNAIGSIVVIPPSITPYHLGGCI